MLVRLNSTPLPRGPRYLAVWEAQDDVVVPAVSAELDGATSVSVQRVCPTDRVRHSGLPEDVVVLGLVAGSIGAGPIPRGVRQTAPDSARDVLGGEVGPRSSEEHGNVDGLQPDPRSTPLSRRGSR